MSRHLVHLHVDVLQGRTVLFSIYSRETLETVQYGVCVCGEECHIHQLSCCGMPFTEVCIKLANPQEVT